MYELLKVSSSFFHSLSRQIFFFKCGDPGEGGGWVDSPGGDYSPNQVVAQGLWGGPLLPAISLDTGKMDKLGPPM